MPANTGNRRPAKHLTGLREEKFVALTIRIPPAAYNEITASADKNKRSLNSEVLCRLERDL